MRESMKSGSNGSAVGVGLGVNPSPGSSVVVSVEVSPESPSSALGQFPVPKSPGFSWSAVHEGHVPAVLELCEFGILSPVLFAKFVTGFIGVNVVSSDGGSHCENTSSPAVVISSVRVLIWDGDWRVVVKRSVDDFVVDDAEHGQLVGTRDITLNGVAAVAAEPTCPAV